MPKAKVAKAPRASRRLAGAPSVRGDAEPSARWFADSLGIPAGDVTDLRARIQKGLGYHAWERFLETTGFTSEMASQVVLITPRTLAGRKVEGRLRTDESDRLVRAARVFSLAVGLFEGDGEAARNWLTQSQPGLGGSTPWDYAATEIGAREVENLIGRLEYGIPS